MYTVNVHFVNLFKYKVYNYLFLITPIQLLFLFMATWNLSLIHRKNVSVFDVKTFKWTAQEMDVYTCFTNLD